MGIDYEAVQARLDVKKKISKILSSQCHPWEPLYSDKRQYEDYDCIRGLLRTHGIPGTVQVFITHPVGWLSVNPIILYTRLVRNEMNLSGVALHDKLCSKCEALRAMRLKGRRMILPEEFTKPPDQEEPRPLGP